MSDIPYLKSKLNRLTREVDALKKKASNQHLGGQESVNYTVLVAEQKKTAHRLKWAIKERKQRKN